MKKNTKHFWPLYLFAVAAAVFITFQTTFLLVTDKWEERVTDMIKTDKTTISENLSSLDQIVKSKSVCKFDSESLLDGTISGYMSGINDRFALYMNPSQYNDYILGASRSNSTGIGISVLYDSTVGGIYVVNVYDDSPAKKAGIVPGDVLTDVNGVAVSKSGFYGAMLKIGDGEINARVKLRVRKPNGTSRDITLVRNVISAKPLTYRMVSGNVGLVRISEFTSDCANTFTVALQELISQGADKFVIDIRNNPGGSMDGVTKTLDFLLPEGTLVTATNKDGAQTPVKSDVNEFASPIVVLTNKNTVCAAEVFAAAVKAAKKGKLVGETTYGKATTQEICALPNGGAISCSTTLYTPSDGISFDSVGVKPDITVSLDESVLEHFDAMTDSDDSQLAVALSVLSEIPAEQLN